MPVQEPNTIVVLGGNAVAGRALTLLLRGVGYDTEYIEVHNTMAPVEETLDGVDVLLLAPAPSHGHLALETFLSLVKSTPKTAQIPVLALSPASGESLDSKGVHVEWPSQLDKVAQAIDAARNRRVV